MDEDKAAAVGAAEQDAGSPGKPPAPALTPGSRWRRAFPGDERQIGAMRRWLTALLPECPARDDLVVVASEMSSNAVLHTASGRGGRFAVEIIWHPLVVRISVADGGAPDGPRVIDDPAREHGRGLHVVRGLSIRTGVHGDYRGRQVWADVPWGATEPTLPQDGYEEAISAGTAALANSFAGVTAWFGRSTLQWWALARGEVLTARSAEEMASLLDHVLTFASPSDRAVRYPDGAGAGQARPPTGSNPPHFPRHDPGPATPGRPESGAPGRPAAGMAAQSHRPGSGPGLAGAGRAVAAHAASALTAGQAAVSAPTDQPLLKDYAC
jgi:anti-sigma regulatory factor (Ser/Thr protein kinase)